MADSTALFKKVRRFRTAASYPIRRVATSHAWSHACDAVIVIRVIVCSIAAKRCYVRSAEPTWEGSVPETAAHAGHPGQSVEAESKTHPM